jgi:uncharacterized protein (TIGR03083 family)
MKPVDPVLTVELFPPLSDELLTVLRSIQPREWARPTICGSWSVKDVAAHLLGGNLGRLWKSSKPSASADRDYDTLVNLINSDNESWVQAAKLISPEILIEFLELTDGHLYDLFRSRDPFEPARVPVTWAGHSQSPNWFDIAREYTEKWHHQQHIREAVGRPLLLGRKWLFPALDTFMRGMPHTYRRIEAEDSTTITVEITGEAGGGWTLLRKDRAWSLFAGLDPKAASRVRIDQDLAWRLFTKGAIREDVWRQTQIDGDQALGSQFLNLVAIMA